MDKAREIYLDYHATTPVLPEVFEAMSPYHCQHFGNANSTHQWGWKAEMAVHKAMKQVSTLVQAKSSQVFFTSGATESIHWVIVGWIRKNKNPLIITTATEHKATYGACEWARELGAEVKVLPVNEYGMISREELAQNIDPQRPTLFSFILANNEIGTINPVQEIVSLKKKFPQLLIHADAAQAVGKIAVNFQDWDLDFLSLSGHKIYAPKGVGVLVIKNNTSLEPLFKGGEQQSNMRAGTIDVSSIVGLGRACEWGAENWPSEHKRLSELRDFMVQELLATGLVKLNGHPTERLPNNMNFTFLNLTTDKLLLKLPKVAFSSSSACSSGAASISHVLKAIGLSDQAAKQSIRFGLGHGTTLEDIKWVTAEILHAVKNASDFHSPNK